MILTLTPLEASEDENAKPYLASDDLFRLSMRYLLRSGEPG